MTEPVHLRVRYDSPESLITAYTSSVSRGGCTLVTGRDLAPGSRFVFELCLGDDEVPLRLDGLVLSSRPLPGARFEVAVEYQTSIDQRRILEDMLRRISVVEGFTALRRFPRIPVNLPARDREHQRRYRVVDLSRGGLLLEGRSIPVEVQPGHALTVEIWLADSKVPVAVTGRVAWVQRGSRVVPVRAGISFPELEDRPRRVIDGLTRLLQPRAVTVAFAELEQAEAAATGLSTQPISVIQPGPDDTVQLIARTLADLLIEDPELQLREIDEATPLNSQELTSVRVGIRGDIDGEAMLTMHREIEAAVTRSGWSLQQFAKALVADACRRLDAAELELEPTGPVAGRPMLTAEDRVAECELTGSRGRFYISVIARTPAALADAEHVTPA